MKINHNFIWFELAVIYFVSGVALGIWMAASGDHGLFPVHAHVNLLGWVSLSLMGLLYRQFPHLAATGLATVHFWLYNLGLPVIFISLTLYLKGNTGIEPVLGAGSSVVGVSVLLFAVNVLKNIRG